MCIRDRAQEESCSKSENIKFGIRARMRSGKTILNHSRFLGYTNWPDGVLVIVPEKAKIIRKIFDLYLQGNGVRKIKRYLEEHGIKTAKGKEVWSTSTIDRMLNNEKYIGQVLMLSLIHIFVWNDYSNQLPAAYFFISSRRYYSWPEK